MAIEDVYAVSYWASNSGPFSNTLSSTMTVGIPTRTVTALASLSEIRTDGGDAAAYIRGWTTAPGPDERFPTNNAQESVVKLTNATRVTFQVHVSNAYAIAIGMVFIHA